MCVSEIPPVAIAIVPELVIVPPLKPLPAVTEVTVPLVAETASQTTVPSALIDLMAFPAKHAEETLFWIIVLSTSIEPLENVKPDDAARSTLIVPLARDIESIPFPAAKVVSSSLSHTTLPSAPIERIELPAGHVPKMVQVGEPDPFVINTLPLAPALSCKLFAAISSVVLSTFTSISGSVAVPVTVIAPPAFALTEVTLPPAPAI